MQKAEFGHFNRENKYHGSLVNAGKSYLMVDYKTDRPDGTRQKGRSFHAFNYDSFHFTSPVLSTTGEGLQRKEQEGGGGCPTPRFCRHQP